MIKVIDNLLTFQELEYLNIFVDNNTIQSDVDKFNNSYKNFIIKSGTLEEVEKTLGRIWLKLIKKIEQQIIFSIKSNCLIFSIKTITTNASNKTEFHFDGPVHCRPLDESYTALLYLNKNWTESMGGLWNGNNLYVIPLENRLLVYSRDIEHAVTPGLGPWPNNRKALLTSWAKSV